MTPYERIYTRFKKKIEDPDLALFTKKEQREILQGYMDTALMYMELEGWNSKLGSNLDDRNDMTMQFNDDLTATEQEIIALLMVAAWYEPKLNSIELTLIYVGSTADKWDNKKAHYESLKGIRDSYLLEARRLFNHYIAKNNGYLSA